MINWNDLNKNGQISPIVGINAVIVKQISQYSGIPSKMLTSSRARIKSELESLGSFNAKISDIITRVDAKKIDCCKYHLRLEDGNYVEIGCSNYCYYPAPSVAKIIEYTQNRIAATREDKRHPKVCEDVEAVGEVRTMNQQHEIKMVPFMGAELMAARDNDGQIWAGVRWMCDGIGLSEGQTKNERLKIQKDKVLSKGGRNFVLNGTGYGNRETLCLKLDYVPLWLAKISITPAIVAETPELADRLEQYQLKAKDVLAAAFLKGNDETYSLSNPSIVKELNSIKYTLANIERKLSYTNHEPFVRAEYNEDWLSKNMPYVKSAAELKGISDFEMLHNIYKMIKKSGVDLDAYIEKYKKLHNAISCSTLSVISFNPELQMAFENVISGIC